MAASRNKGITRRRFTIGGIAAAATAAAAGALTGCGDNQGSDDTSGEPQVVKDDSKIVTVLEQYKSADVSLEAASTWTLPLGTLLYHCEGTWAAAMMAPESAQHANTLGVLSLLSGDLTTLIDTPTQGGLYRFYDVRCSDSVFAWIEMDYAASKWVLMAQNLSAAKLSGKPVKLDAGNMDYDPPLFTVTSSSVIWYKMPSTTGSKTAASSYCYRRAVSDSSPTTVWKSTGRFACRPRVSDGVLTITPRVRNSEGVYYGLTALDTNSNYNRVAQLVLPTAVKPFELEYMNGKFVFSIEASYDGVGSLGKMGTFIGKEGGPYIYLGREPLASVAGKGPKYFVKSQSSHFLIDTSAKTYGTLLSPDRSLDYGDYPASEGTTDRFLTYSTVRNDQGVPENVVARLFSL